MPMGPFDLLPGGASTLTGSQTGCGGCNFSTTFNVQGIRNQISGQFTGVPAFTVTTGSTLGALPARTFTLPLYNSAIGSGINNLLLTGAATVTWAAVGASGNCTPLTGIIYYPTGSGSICYDPGTGCDVSAPCIVPPGNEKLSIQIHPSLYGPTFNYSIPTGMWAITVINTTVTGSDPFNYSQYYLYNNTGMTGWIPSSGYSYSGVYLSNQSSMEIPCGGGGSTTVMMQYYVYGASGQPTGTYFVPMLNLHKNCSPCIAI